MFEPLKFYYTKFGATNAYYYYHLQWPETRQISEEKATEWSFDSKRKSLSESNLLAHCVRHSTCRRQVIDAYVLHAIRDCKRPPPSNFFTDLNKMAGNVITEESNAARTHIMPRQCKYLTFKIAESV